jgi:hypothetical protein
MHTEEGEEAATAAPETGEPAYAESPQPAGSDSDTFAERPELFVGAAFVGGFALAQIVKRIGR